MSDTVTSLKRWNMSAHWKRTLLSTGTVLTSGADSVSVAATDTVTHGGSVPNWKRRIALCQSATTSLVGTHRKLISHSGSMDVVQESPKVLCQVVGDLHRHNITFNTPSGSVDPVADSKARAKLLSHYIEMINEWRGGNFLAEVRETIHFLHSPVKSFYKSTWDFAGSVRKLGRVKQKSPVEYGKALSNAWLAYAFGAKPLVQDANDAATALNHLGGGTAAGFDTKTISGFGRNSLGNILVQTGSLSTPLSIGAAYDNVTKTDNTVRYRGAFKCGLPGVRKDLQQLGLDVFDIVPAVWEAIPWSFFIDYFANVQEVLDGYRLWDANVGWFMVTVRNSGTRNLQSNRGVPVAGGLTPSVSGGSAYALVTQVNRGPSNIPHPDWRFQMPGFPSLKWLNIAALARQCYGSAPKGLKDLPVDTRGRHTFPKGG
jgi:hypothetical protein